MREMACKLVETRDSFRENNPAQNDPSNVFKDVPERSAFNVLAFGYHSALIKYDLPKQSLWGWEYILDIARDHGPVVGMAETERICDIGFPIR